MVIGMQHTNEDVRIPLSGDWTLAATTPGQLDSPDPDRLAALSWQAAEVPGTVASARRQAASWKLGEDNAFGTADHWFRCRFPRPEQPGDAWLHFGGLATIADVWLNGQHLLHSDNMFLSHTVPVSDLGADNELLIRCHALEPLLSQRRPRPRWRTGLVKHQTLRWYRTTLLGQVPAWCPDVVAVGPWRDIELSVSPRARILSSELKTSITDGTGRVEVDVHLATTQPVTKAELQIGNAAGELAVSPAENGVRVRGHVEVADAELWWPHSHGDQPLYPLRLVFQLDGSEVEVDAGRVGFREITPVDAEQPGVSINGVPVYCRGACWSSLDICRLSADPASYRAALETARDAGMNMLRVGGTMVYEHPEFYRLCDELGIMVWQDFMFASMDYPADDQEFGASVATEARQFLLRTQSHCCMAVLCGGSEIQQQAAMLGLPREVWTNTLFAETLPAICTALRPDLPYWESSPTGGALPFHNQSGVAHYFGVGAYQQAIDAARLHPPRFASECLAFSNVPEPQSLAALAGGGFTAPHHPTYKARVPRDTGTGWDFADITDHYVEQVFGVDPRQLRYSDCERYFACCRIGIGEVLKTVAGFWRADSVANQGALVWFFQDLWNGAGWGLVDADGLPKASLYYLRRAWAPQAVWLVDEKLDGLRSHVANDAATPLVGTLVVRVLGAGSVTIAEGREPIEVAPRSQVSVQVDALLDRFLDTTRCYRFGPSTHQAVTACLHDAAGRVISDDVFFPGTLPSHTDSSIDLTAEVKTLDHGDYRVVFRTEQFCQAIAIEVSGFVPDDNYFHLGPGCEKTVVLRPDGAASRFRGYAQAFNSTHSVRLASP